MGYELTGDYQINTIDNQIIKRHQLMSHYHWSYLDYCNTPAQVIDECYACIKTENKATEDKNG